MSLLNFCYAKTTLIIAHLLVTSRLTLIAQLLVAGISVNAYAADLDKNLPAEGQGNFIAPINVDLPSQPLDVSLQQFARKSGVSVSFDNDLARNKTAPAVKGSMTRKEALRRLLMGSGLEANIDDGSAVIKASPDKDAMDMKLDAVNVRAKRFYEVGPLPGLGLTLEQIPGNVQSITAKEIKESRSLSLTDLMNRNLQSVNVNDYQGNPFQMDVTYRGFTAGPQIGTPQGLSVFFDGIRVNEPFGDVVNWDMIPMNALAGVDVFPGSNPIFGLNTLGGAFTVKTKDGFNHAGLDADILTGSFGRKQMQLSGGWNNGTVGLFGAGNFFLEDGWRKNSPSDVNQFFGKGSYRGNKLDLNLSTLIVGNDLVGNGVVPSEIYAQGRDNVFTSPDETKNRLQQFQLSGSYFVNDTFTVTGQVYRRNSKRHSIGTDVMTDYNENYSARRLPAAGEEHTCLLLSSTVNGKPNLYGLPNYIVIPINLSQGEDFSASDFANDYQGFNGGVPGQVDLAGKYAPNLNAELPLDFVAGYKPYIEFNKDFQSNIYDRSNPTVNDSGPVVQVFNGSGFQDVNTYRYGGSIFFGPPGGTGILTAAQAFTPDENVMIYSALSDDSYYLSKQGNDDIKNYVIFLPA
ncbi:MAG: TonB-dependent receptor plug domain-containing protein, partial [Methylophilaceae bacterium]